MHIQDLRLQTDTSKIRSLYLWTERGAMLHAKSLNTDIAWEAYERLVDYYFESGERSRNDQLQIALVDMIPQEIKTYYETIQEVLDNEPYRLRKKGEPELLSIDYLGYYDKENITISAAKAYNIYAEKSDTPMGKNQISTCLSALRLYDGEYFKVKLKKRKNRKDGGYYYRIAIKNGLLRIPAK